MKSSNSESSNSEIIACVYCNENEKIKDRFFRVRNSSADVLNFEVISQFDVSRKFESMRMQKRRKLHVICV